MSEVRIAEFVRRAEAAVVPPDLGAIADRGRRLRRRRTGLLAAAAAVVVGGLLAVADRAPDVRPVEGPRSQVRSYPGGLDLPPLTAGTYEQVLAREVTAGAARFTVPAEWRGWYGPNLPYLERGYVGLLVGDVERVARGACSAEVSPMREVGDSVEDLVPALTDLPRFEVVEEPAVTRFAGHDAVHLTLRGPTRRTCPGTIEVWDSPGSGGLIPSPPRGSTLELWAVDLDGEAVLVSATSAPGTPGWALRELDDVVGSVELERLP